MRQEAFTILCDSAIIAFSDLAAADGLHYKQLNLPVVSDLLKSAVNSGLETILSEWDQATQADISGQWLRALISAQATGLARSAYTQYKETV